jgi:hypothetical protein
MTDRTDELPSKVLMALERGQKIEAIKLLREARGLGLKEAKEAVDAYQPSGRPVSGSVVQGGGGSRLPWLIGAILLALLVIWLMGGL